MQKNIPKLRFKEFTEEWETKKLGEVALQSTLKNIENKKLEVLSCTKYTGLVPSLKYFKKQIFGNDVSKYKIVPKGYFVYATNHIEEGSIGYQNLMDKALVSPMYTVFKKIKEIDDSFLYRLLKTHKMIYVYQSNMSGSINRRGGLRWNVFKTIQIAIPTLPEQKKIGKFLSLIDRRIELLEKKRVGWEQYKKGVMQKIFTQEIRFKDEKGENFPDWERKKLGEVCEKKSSNISANTLFENDGNYKIYGASGFLQNVDFFREDNPYISIVKDGAGVGRTLLCEGKSSVLGTLDIIKPKANNSLNFLFALFNRIHFVKYIKGSTIPHIYYRDYSKEEIYIPTLPEQTKIADFLSLIDRRIEFLKKENENLKKYKKGLLQKMFV